MALIFAVLGILYFMIRCSGEKASMRAMKSHSNRVLGVSEQLANSAFEAEYFNKIREYENRISQKFISSYEDDTVDALQDPREQIIDEIKDDLKYVFQENTEKAIDCFKGYMTYDKNKFLYGYDWKDRIAGASGFRHTNNVIWNIWLSKHGYLDYWYSFLGYQYAVRMEGLETAEEFKNVPLRACKVIERNIQKTHPDIPLRIFAYEQGKGTSEAWPHLSWEYTFDSYITKPTDAKTLKDLGIWLPEEEGERLALKRAQEYARREAQRIAWQRQQKRAERQAMLENPGQTAKLIAQQIKHSAQEKQRVRSAKRAEKWHTDCAEGIRKNPKQWGIFRDSLK